MINLICVSSGMLLLLLLSLCCWVSFVSSAPGLVNPYTLNAEVDELENEHRMHPVLNFQRRTGSSSNQQRRLQKRAMPKLTFRSPNPDEEESEYWRDNAQDILRNQLHKTELNMNVAKNVILFLGDGMSIPTLTAARVYMGGEERQLSFEKFPYVGLSKTYCTNTQVADSACTATAYLGGVKANYGTIGVSAAVDLNNCRAQNNTEHHVASIAEWAQIRGLATGLITTTSVTHASPAGVYAHTANRNWENDGEILKDGEDPEQCPDIAQQLIYGTVGRNLNIIMGGGREQFMPKEQKDIWGGKGKRHDNQDLIDKWKSIHNGASAFVQTKEQLSAVPKDVEFLMGVFGTSHIPFHVDADNETIPTLAEMVDKAMDILEAQNRGYFLFVEGGRIDHAHHDTEAVRALDETIEFHKAIDLARNRTSVEDTLIVVTSDHSHTMSVAGYSSRKNDIFGINNGQLGTDDFPYATLSYANGPGFQSNMAEGGRRRNLLQTNMKDKNFRFPAMVPLDSETHGGDDVGVFASGPQAHLFTGVYEQHYIPHAMAYVACLGDKMTACTKT